MKFSLFRDYVPTRQQESDDGTENSEKEGMLPSRDSEESQLRHYTPKSTIGMAIGRWLPWSLLACVLTINLFVWIKMKNTAKDDTLFCETSKLSVYLW